MFVAIGPEYVELLRARRASPPRPRRRASDVERMGRTVLEHGWDGEWFLRAYDDFGQQGRARGSAQDGQIFIETQGFCVMARDRPARPARPAKALDSVKERLDTQYGIVLQQPAYRPTTWSWARSPPTRPGYKENAGIFCHNNPWIMIAETRGRARPERAFEYYRKIAPAYLEDISELHRIEPYVYSQMIAGKDAVRHGEAKNSWLTGHRGLELRGRLPVPARGSAPSTRACG